MRNFHPRYTLGFLLKMEPEMEIKRFRAVTGDSYAVLLNSQGFPLEYPCLYITLHHRNCGHSDNTCKKELENIRYLMQICSAMGVDLMKRLRAGELLTQFEIETIGVWAGKKKSSLDAHRDSTSTQLCTRPSLKRLETARANIIVNNGDEVAPHTTYNRLTTFAEYIGWLESYLSPRKSSHTVTLFKKLRPRDVKPVEVQSGAETYKSLSESEIASVFDLVKPGSSLNPWRSKSVQIRNALIFELLNAVGCRRSELLRIRIDDIFVSPHNGQKYLDIRTSTDTDDFRLNKPQAKTSARKFPINSRLAQLIDDYVIFSRSTIAGADKCPYLLITHRKDVSANALSIAALDKVFMQAKQVLGFNLSAHMFRHAWNDRFSEFVDKLIQSGRISEARAESDRQKLMGWSADSKMALHYSQRYQEQKAVAIALKLQEKSR